MATEKFKALAHFIMHECGDNPGRLGATRLNKALWHTDVLAYRATGQSVTGDRYVKRQNGPVPAEILATINELSEEGKIMVREPQHQYDPRKYISLDDPDTSTLSESDIDLARFAIRHVCSKTTTAVSDETHDVIWDAAKIGEHIPMCATLAGRSGEITESVAEWALSVIENEDRGASL